MNLFQTAKIVLLALVFLISSSFGRANHARSTALGLPELRAKQVDQFEIAKMISQHDSEELQSLEKATTSLRGGAGAALPTKAIYGIAVMGLIEAGLKKLFAATGINFPSQLGGCIVLFAVAVLAQSVSPGAGDAIQEFLDPGCALLNKWLPSFFVPGLAMLPLAPSIGSGMEVSP